jgi:hypothetical protein
MANQIYLDKSLEIYEKIISIQAFKNYKDYINSFKINLKSSKVFKKNLKLSMGLSLLFNSIYKYRIYD